MKEESIYEVKSMFDLKLNESLRIDGYRITKVPGGFIYCREESLVNIANPVFVPFSDK